MDEIAFRPIGYIKSPFKSLSDIPRQSIYAAEKIAEIEINEEYVKGLLHLDNHSHIIVLFHFHQSPGFDLCVKRPGNSPLSRGVFATRSPHRPNAIGLSIVELLEMKGNKLIIRGVDMLDGTPVLDIKPYSAGLNP